jgi:hypothetical protein
MKFNPTNQDDLDANALWPKGIYAFKIIGAEQKVSSGGNDMFELRVEVRRRDGATRILRDYILPKRAEKFMHAAAACELREEYESGSLEAEDFLDRTGKLKLGTEKSRDFPDRNVVLDYL